MIMSTEYNTTHDLLRVHLVSLMLKINNTENVFTNLQTLNFLCSDRLAIRHSDQVQNELGLEIPFLVDQGLKTRCICRPALTID